MILINLFHDSLFTIVNCVYPLHIATRREKRDIWDLSFIKELFYNYIYRQPVKNHVKFYIIVHVYLSFYQKEYLFNNMFSV